jgi:hypothetical protein
MLRQTGKFNAYDDNGEVYTIFIYTNFIAVNSRRGNATLPGKKQLLTEDGENVNWLAKGQYQIVQTCVLLHSEAHDAP